MKKKVEEQASFLSYLKEREQRIDWLILVFTCVVAYVIIKICFPFPATMSDSATYVVAAAQDSFSFYRPFGYSYFLQIVHGFSSNIHFLFATQILLYLFSSALFAFSLKYFVPPRNKLLWRLLLFLFVCSPICFYMANAIMSDLLFAVIIYLMLASFLFIVKRQSWIALFILLCFIFCLLHIRYSAIIFPVVFIVLLFVVKGYIRWVGIISIVVVVLTFHSQMKDNMKQSVGVYQYSTGFDGWQFANNGLHIQPFVTIDPNTISDMEIRSVYLFSEHFKDDILNQTKDGTYPVASFMWLNHLPLKQYLFHYIDATKEPYPLAWVKVGSGSFKKYGEYMIKKYPLEFLRYYYLPNSKQVFYPDQVGLISDYVTLDTKEIKEWYRIPEGQDLSAKYPELYNVHLKKIIPISHFAIWISMLMLIVVSVVYRQKMEMSKDEKKILWSLTVIGVIYYASTIFASPIGEARFWLPMTAIRFAIIYLLVNSCYSSSKIGEWQDE